MQMELLLEADCSSSPCGSRNGLAPDGSWERTSPDFSAAMKGATLAQWLESWLGSGLMFRETDGQMPAWHWDREDSSSGQLWMRNIAEWTPILEPSLKDDGVCSLSEILEPSGSIDPRYFLSPKACAGILRRAEARGKELPEALAHALRVVADSEQTSK